MSRWNTTLKTAAGATLLGCVATGLGCTRALQGPAPTDGPKEIDRAERPAAVEETRPSTRYVVEGDFFKRGFERSARPQSTTPAQPVIAARGQAGATPAHVNLDPDSSLNRAPIPTMPSTGPDDLPPDVALDALSAESRAELLAGLGLDLREATRASDATRVRRSKEALRRVVGHTAGPSLDATLRIAKAKGSLGFIVESIGLDALLEAGKAKGVRVNDVLATSDSVRVRGLTSRETEFVRKIFRSSFDPERVRLHFTTDLSMFQTHTLVIGNTMFVDRNWRALDLEPGTTVPKDPRDNEAYYEVLLGRQMKHVRSYQLYGARYAIDSLLEQLNARNGVQGGSGYDVAGLKSGGRKGVGTLSGLQKAELMEDYVRARRSRSRFVRLDGVRGNKTVDRREYLRIVEPIVTELLAEEPKKKEDRFADWTNRNSDKILADARRFMEDRAASGTPLGEFEVALFGGAVGLAFVASGEGPADGSGMLGIFGIPTGVALAFGDALDRVYAAAHVEWSKDFKDPRVRFQGSYERDLGESHRVTVGGYAVVGFNRTLNEIGGEVRAERGDFSAGLAGSVTRDSDGARVYTGRAEVEANGTKVTGSATVATDKSGHPEEALLDVQVDMGKVRVNGSTTAPNGTTFDRGDLGVEMDVSDRTTVGASVELRGSGVESATIQVISEMGPEDESPWQLEAEVTADVHGRNRLARVTLEKALKNSAHLRLVGEGGVKDGKPQGSVDLVYKHDY